MSEEMVPVPEQGIELSKGEEDILSGKSRAERRDWAEMGRKGGSTTKARHGAEMYSAAGKKGGQTCKERHGSEHFAAAGRKGGNRTAELIRKGKEAVKAEE